MITLLLLVAFQSLQFTIQPNIYGWQRPGLDINGPFHYQLNPAVPARLDIVHTSKGDILKTHWCVYTVDGHNFKCSEWYPRLF